VFASSHIEAIAYKGAGIVLKSCGVVEKRVFSRFSFLWLGEQERRDLSTAAELRARALSAYLEPDEQRCYTGKEK
jgi:hypothetical protein